MRTFNDVVDFLVNHIKQHGTENAKICAELNPYRWWRQFLVMFLESKIKGEWIDFDLHDNRDPNIKKLDTGFVNLDIGAEYCKIRKVMDNVSSRIMGENTWITLSFASIGSVPACSPGLWFLVYMVIIETSDERRDCYIRVFKK